PISPLLPYTTLFRSYRPCHLFTAQCGCKMATFYTDATFIFTSHSLAYRYFLLLSPLRPCWLFVQKLNFTTKLSLQLPRAARFCLDRKSTRLNSSHVS